MKVSLRTVTIGAFIVYALLFWAGLAYAQLPMGVPDLCANSPDNVAAGQVVTVSGTKACLGIHGDVTITGTLLVDHILVYADGSLTIADGATVMFRDFPFDFAADPEQWGHGLIVFGRLRATGTSKIPFVRLTTEVSAGQVFTPPTVAGWLATDQLVLTETRQSRTDSQSERIVRGQAAQFSHLGARNPDGALVFLPHIANLTRSIVIRSQNPTGVRGHIAMIGRADVDLRSVEIRDLGRTTGDMLDSTVMVDGKPTHIGTNQIGRYALHFHHLTGPVTPQTNGKQFTAINLSVWGNRKWGIAVHNTHWGLVQDSVVYDGQGAGIVTEDGSETANQFIGNFVAKFNNFGVVLTEGEAGNPVDPFMRQGSCFALRGPTSELRGNVCADTREGLNYLTQGFENGPTSGNQIVRVPKAQGLDTMLDDSVTPIPVLYRPRLVVDDNEVYATTRYGLGLWMTGIVPEPPISRLRIWHTQPGQTIGWENAAIIGKYTDFQFTDLTLLNEGGQGLGLAHFNDALSVTGHRPTIPSSILRGEIRGFQQAWAKVGQLGQAPWWDVRDVTIQAGIGFTFNNGGQSVGNTDPDGVERHKFYLTNARFFTLPNLPLRTVELTTVTSGDVFKREFDIQIVNYQAQPNDSFRLYFVTPPLGSGPAPCSTTRGGFIGFTCPLDGTPPPPPPPQEICGDGIDNDGDGQIDEGCPVPPPAPPPTGCALSPITIKVTAWPTFVSGKATQGKWTITSPSSPFVIKDWTPTSITVTNAAGCVVTKVK